ncbi:MAG TPA: transposase [Pyrinomonadaceae bacterium]|jgi:REP element-mobilizing transposase RayT|nr:transposase [Pyrinomonadaceae bacterium]
MPHSYVNNLMHCTFSTKERFPFIDAELESRLWPYIGGIARENRMKALAIGGTHALLSLPATMSFAKAVQLIKGGSSKWIHDTFSKYRKFEWQEGYGAFSVSSSQANRTIAYINNQKEHHRKRTFEEEFLELLDKHGVAYDRRYVFRCFQPSVSRTANS